MNLTYYGHACFGVELVGKHLLFDPFISPNPLVAKIDLQRIPADVIFISHGHEDHLADAAAIAQRTGALVVSNYEIVQWFAATKGLKNVHPMNLGGSKTFDFGTVKSTIAHHSSVLPDGTYGGNPGGFTVRSPQGSFYYSGDTALTQDMKLIGEEGPVGTAIVCIGDNFTMGAADAALATKWAGAKKAVGVHYDTFPPIQIDRTAARAAFEHHGLALHLPAIGETITL